LKVTTKIDLNLSGAALLEAVQQNHPEWVVPVGKLDLRCRVPAQTPCWKVSYGTREVINGFNGEPQSTDAIYVDENGLFLFLDDGVFVDAAGNVHYEIMGELTLAMVRKLALHVDAATQRKFNARVEACAAQPTV
jgi:hypothetical protein